MNVVRVTRTGEREARPHSKAPLVKLAERIVHSHDQEALRELHNHRTPFRLRADRPMTFVEFVTALSETTWALRVCGCDRSALELAQDRTIDQFSLLPDNRTEETHRGDGADCRHYFSRFLRTLKASGQNDNLDHSLQQEARAAWALQRLVVTQFRLSCLEARRSCNPARSRYAWHLESGTLYVWMPASFSGHKRRSWLEDNVDAPDPSRPDERYRVQAIIDAYFGVARQFSFTSGAGAVADVSSTNDPLAAAIAAESTGYELAHVLAEKKADKIDQQRFAIRALGKDRLKTLILSIFGALANGHYVESQLAQAFGLSKATLSRFAGSRWRLSARVPDLWRNCAASVANDGPLVEAAEEAGVWMQIRSILRNSGDASAGAIDDA